MFKFILLLSFFINQAFALATMEEARFLYSKAISESGNISIVNEAEKAYLELEGHKPEIGTRIRLASIMALKAKFSSVFKSTGYVNDSIDGFTKIEEEMRGVSDVNVIYEFHLFRGRTFYKFPSIFGKKKIAASDVKKAIEMLPSLTIKRDDAELARLFLTYAQVKMDEGEKLVAKEYAAKAIAYNTLEKADVEEARKIAS